MLYVVKDNLVVEEKGIYSVEKFLVARRLMYWQVYLHKTGVAAEQLLIRVLKRAKEVTDSGIKLKCSPALSYFLKNKINMENFDVSTLKVFSKLDDYDIVSAMKEWMEIDDFVLSNLSEMLLNRNLLKVKLKNKPPDQEKLRKYRAAFQIKYNLTEHEAAYFVFSGEISNVAYSSEKNKIQILHRNGKTTDVAKASDQLNLKALSKEVTKYYICYPKAKD